MEPAPSIILSQFGPEDFALVTSDIRAEQAPSRENGTCPLSRENPAFKPEYPPFTQNIPPYPVISPRPFSCITTSTAKTYMEPASTSLKTPRLITNHLRNQTNSSVAGHPLTPRHSPRPDFKPPTSNLKSTWSFSLLPFYFSLSFNPFQILNHPLQKLEYPLRILDYPLQMLEYPLQVLPLDLLPADKLHRPSQRTIPP